MRFYLTSKYFIEQLSQCVPLVDLYIMNQSVVLLYAVASGFVSNLCSYFEYPWSDPKETSLKPSIVVF